MAPSRIIHDSDDDDADSGQGQSPRPSILEGKSGQLSCVDGEGESRDDDDAVQVVEGKTSSGQIRDLYQALMAPSPSSSVNARYQGQPHRADANDAYAASPSPVEEVIPIPQDDDSEDWTPAGRTKQMQDDVTGGTRKTRRSGGGEDLVEGLKKRKKSRKGNNAEEQSRTKRVKASRDESVPFEEVHQLQPGVEIHAGSKGQTKSKKIVRDSSRRDLPYEDPSIVLDPLAQWPRVSSTVMNTDSSMRLPSQSREDPSSSSHERHAGKQSPSISPAKHTKNLDATQSGDELSLPDPRHHGASSDIQNVSPINLDGSPGPRKKGKRGRPPGKKAKTKAEDVTAVDVPHHFDGGEIRHEHDIEPILDTPPPVKKRGRKKKEPAKRKVPIVDTDDEGGSEAAEGDAYSDDDEGIQVHTKAEASLEATPHGTATAISPPKGKKRGRKKKETSPAKKEQEQHTAEIRQQDVAKEQPTTAAKHGTPPIPQPLSPLHPNQAPTTTNTPKTNDIPPTEKKKSSSTTPGPGPGNGSGPSLKNIYRVGLSKKARIEPLLRLKGR
ncbi:MAG: hypothetical protein M1817_005549 [Caeruleum heppii]|nr:MAG: hypothetical protein M1817_005549 [Caeruleum heppii]